jgi:hypothetical protein
MLEESLRKVLVRIRQVRSLTRLPLEIKLNQMSYRHYFLREKMSLMMKWKMMKKMARLRKQKA